MSSQILRIVLIISEGRLQTFSNKCQNDELWETEAQLIRKLLRVLWMKLWKAAPFCRTDEFVANIWLVKLSAAAIGKQRGIYCHVGGQLVDRYLTCNFTENIIYLFIISSFFFFSFTWYSKFSIIPVIFLQSLFALKYFVWKVFHVVAKICLCSVLSSVTKYGLNIFQAYVK
jgi:hypothetical protein